MFKIYCWFAAVFILLPFIAPCPPSQSLYPCVCSIIGSEIEVTCSHLENEQFLTDALHALRHTKKLYSFTIKDSVFRFIPQDLFSDVKVHEIQIESSSFMALTDKDVAFEGLENDLASLVITNSHLLNTWDWIVFKNMKNLIKLHVDVDLNAISEDIHSICCMKLKDISFAKNHIEYIHDTAFAGFSELLSIALNRNQIVEVKRSMFPNPAPLLWKLDLGHNVIEQLPPDMFENMPSLETLNVESNKLLTLSDKTFRNVWRQLKSFDAMDNPLRCDCRLIWMTELKNPDHMNAVCEKPQNLAGKHLEDLSEKDLWC